MCLCSGADLSTLDGNTLNPIMLAIQDGHEETITSMISENPVIMKKEILPGRNVIEWALDKRYAVFFKVHKLANQTMFRAVLCFAYNTNPSI